MKKRKKIIIIFFCLYFFFYLITHILLKLRNLIYLHIYILSKYAPNIPRVVTERKCYTQLVMSAEKRRTSSGSTSAAGVKDLIAQSNIIGNVITAATSQNNYLDSFEPLPFPNYSLFEENYGISKKRISFKLFDVLSIFTLIVHEIWSSNFLLTCRLRKKAFYLIYLKIILSFFVHRNILII